MLAPRNMQHLLDLLHNFACSENSRNSTSNFPTANVSKIWTMEPAQTTIEKIRRLHARKVSLEPEVLPIRIESLAFDQVSAIAAELLKYLLFMRQQIPR